MKCYATGQVGPLLQARILHTLISLPYIMSGMFSKKAKDIPTLHQVCPDLWEKGEEKLTGAALLLQQAHEAKKDVDTSNS